MGTPLIDRIELLYATDQIDHDIYHILPTILDKVEQQLQVKLFEENAGAFVSHISLALQRCKEQKPLMESSDEVASLSSQYPHYDQLARELLSGVGGQHLEIAAEASFLTLYFVLLTGEESK